MTSGSAPGGWSPTVTAPSSAASAKFTVTPKNGEVAYLWYISTADNTAATAHLCALTTVPVFSFTSDPTVGNTGNETVSALTAADFSQNNGSAGGQSNQVTAFDGLLTQAWNNTNLSPQNAYVNNLAGALLTTAGKGNVNEIDALLMQMWNLYKVTVDVIWCNAQELANIARTFEEDLEKDERFVLSLSSLKKLDDMEKLTKRIRSRMKRY